MGFFFDLPHVVGQAAGEIGEPPDAPGADIQVEISGDDEDLIQVTTVGPSGVIGTGETSPDVVPTGLVGITHVLGGGGGDSGTFSKASPDQFDDVRDSLVSSLREQYPTISLTASDLTSRINRAAADFRADNGAWPRFSQLVDSAYLNRYIIPWLQGFPNLDPFFEVAGTVYFNDEFEGPRPLPPPRVVAGVTFGGDLPAVGTPFEASGRTTGEASLVRNLVQPRGDWRRFDSIDQLQELLAQVSPVKAPSGGGGRRRGGGAGRAPRPFDKAELLEAANTMESSLLRRDPQAAQAWVDAYMKEAQAFWMSDGGNLDFETFILNRIRADSEYAGLYRHKPPQMSERQFAALYENVTGGGGLNPDQQEVFTQRGMRQGLAFQGIGEQVAQSRPVQRRGGFVDRLAGAVQAIGARG